jgi:pyruvate formate lyase activating enzyme
MPIATIQENQTTILENNPLKQYEKMGHVHSIETCGTVDGAGLRYILFLSGCPLRCQYCHNPDAQGAPCGKEMTPLQAFQDIAKYKNFIRKGGLTISGGEPLMQSDFVEAIFNLAKNNNIHTALDTSGFLGDRATDSLLNVTDLVLLDIKSWIPETYKKVTEVSLEPTIRFAKRLAKMKKEVWIRFVLVPGLTDSKENIEGVARFIRSLPNITRLDVLPFHKMGENKYRALSMPYQLFNTEVPTQSEMEAALSIFHDHGLAHLIHS